MRLYRTGIAEVMGSPQNFFWAFFATSLAIASYLRGSLSLSSYNGYKFNSHLTHFPTRLHSSVGRASHRYRGCHGFESVPLEPQIFFWTFFACNWLHNCEDSFHWYLYIRILFVCIQRRDTMQHGMILIIIQERTFSAPKGRFENFHT